MPDDSKRARGLSGTKHPQLWGPRARNLMDQQQLTEARMRVLTIISATFLPLTLVRLEGLAPRPAAYGDAIYPPSNRRGRPISSISILR